MQPLAKLWDEPLIGCPRKGRPLCAFAIRVKMPKDVGIKYLTDCALPTCAYYKRPSRRYESNQKRPR